MKKTNSLKKYNRIGVPTGSIEAIQIDSSLTKEELNELLGIDWRYSKPTLGGFAFFDSKGNEYGKAFNGDFIYRSRNRAVVVPELEFKKMYKEEVSA
jgi:hypothetical protein